jgi:hypothetical protein
MKIICRFIQKSLHLSIYAGFSVIGFQGQDVLAQTCTDNSNVVLTSGQTCSNSGVNGRGVNNPLSISNTGGTITSGTPGGTNYGIGVYNNRAINEFVRYTNSGSIIGTSDSTAGYLSGIWNGNTIDTITNTGTISVINTRASYTNVVSAGILLTTNSRITTLINSGTASSITGSATNASNLAYGIYLNAGASIVTLTNEGTISGTTSAYGIKNGGTITTFNNAQGGDSTTSARTALTYTGVLPTNYNIIINSKTNYGQLAVTSGTGSTTFGIGAGSTVTNNTKYTSVISGLSSGFNTSGANFNGYSWALSLQSGSSTVWDLCFGNCNPSSTYRPNTIAYLKNHAANAAGVLDSLYTNAAMARVTTALDGLSGAAQANAITQTLPAITGAASQATTSSMQALNQIVQGRSSSLRGMSSGDDYIGNRDVWMKGFGSWANQNDVNGVSGYKVNTGGLAIGVDQGFTPKLNIGAVLALSNSGVSSNSSSAPSGVTINSYQVGVYGDYAIEKSIIANAQADIGMNQNKEYRNITFMGTNANGNYNSYSGHLGTGVKYLMPINPENTFIPSVRVDYTTVQSQAYSESGAGVLNLSVAKQTYNTLIPSADVRIDHSIDSKMTLSANAGAGYNTLNNQVSATSAYAGGGTTFATNGLQVSPWLYNAGLGITGQLEKNLQLNVRYDNVFSPTGYMNQMVSAKLKMAL